MKTIKPIPIEVSLEEVQALLKELDNHIADEKARDLIKGIIETYIYMIDVLEQESISINRLLGMLFGSKTESSKNVLKNLLEPPESVESVEVTEYPEPIDIAESEQKKAVNGHGRNPANAYTGAQRIYLTHETLKAGQRCPVCVKGKLYKQKEPGIMIRLVGKPPVDATIYELEKLRCNLCEKIFTAQAPPEIGKAKYDETAGAMIALLKYGSGFPFYRFSRLQSNLGIPIAESTQWEIVESVAISVYTVFEELKREAAQGKVVHNDDTGMKILEMLKEQETSERKGMFTTGIISISADWKIALYFTGRKHAGENIEDVLKQRDRELGFPIQMCDALSRNLPKELETILCNCLTHGRRNFVDIVSNFPEECKYVIKTLGKVYKNDEETKEMTSEERLKYHQRESSPLMEELHKWFTEQIKEKKVEPNSGLGKAIAYMLKHWEQLTRFLNVADAPIDNNICERALKKAVLNRKNALFYKTKWGAYVGDLFMSLIHTCELMGKNPFNYITELQKNSKAVMQNPQHWLPWNYEATLSELPP
jgi:transposase